MRDDENRNMRKSDRWGDMTGWVVNHVKVFDELFKLTNLILNQLEILPNEINLIFFYLMILC